MSVTEPRESPPTAATRRAAAVLRESAERFRQLAEHVELHEGTVTAESVSA